MEKFGNLCKILRKRGYTLSEIAQATGRPKTSVYFHIKTIPKTEHLRLKLLRIKIKGIEGKGPVKGKSLLDRHCSNFEIWTPKYVNLFAHVIFDGSIRNTGILYHNRSQALLDNFSHKIKSVYKFNPKIYKTGNGVSRLAYHNVELAPLFREKTAELLSIVTNLKKRLQKEFLRAFFDDEGSVDFRKLHGIRRIRGYQHNDRILRIVKKLLRNFEIESKIDTKFHEIVIGRRQNLKKFSEKINFSSGLRINGQRPNSIWKKSLEKRKILTNLLASYK